jgi:probable biosynthetic protein (TIGR04098 family)
MHRSNTRWHLGMPHTISGALAEVALLAYAQDQHWKEIGRLAGCPASRLVDVAGKAVYASVYFVELDTASDRGLAVFGPDDELELEGSLGRYGASMLDGTHRLYRAGSVQAESAAPSLRMSFVLVALGRGPDDLRVSTPSNGRIDRIPSLATEPDSYRLVRAAQSAGGFGSPPPGSAPLWDGVFSRTYPINPDRDLNGVGLLYFANYVAFLDAAEREAFGEMSGMSAGRLDGRVTVRRRIAYYGNARSSDQLHIDVEAFALDGLAPTRWVVHQRIRRASDDRLIALATGERRLRGSHSGPTVD